MTASRGIYAPRTRGSIEEGVHYEVRSETGCWEWIRYRDPNGYGRISRNGRKGALAHRVMYEQDRGAELAPEVKLCHSCDNPCCINPGHLFEGTQADNLRDMRIKGRGNLGHVNGHACLDESDVRRIKKLLGDGHLFQREIADLFGVNRTTINDIKCGRTWTHVKET